MNITHKYTPFTLPLLCTGPLRSNSMARVSLQAICFFKSQCHDKPVSLCSTRVLTCIEVCCSSKKEQVLHPQLIPPVSGLGPNKYKLCITHRITEL